MSTLTTGSAPTREPVRLRVPGVSLPRVVVSEWIKLRSVRSTVIGLGLSVAVLVVVGLITSGTMGETFASGAAPDGAPFLPKSPVQATLGGVAFAQLLIGAFGVLSVSSEYSTGMIRASVSTVPTRLPVLWAKCLVYGLVVLALTSVSVIVVFFAGAELLSGHGVEPSLSDPGVLRAVATTPVYLVGVGLLAISLAVLVRNTAAAVSTIAFVLFLLDSLAMLLPSGIADAVVPYLPATLGQAFMNADGGAGAEVELLDPASGIAVFTGYVVVALAAAALAFKRRDV